MNHPSGITTALKTLADQIQGDVYIDDLHRMIYATDASVYQEKPLAVVRPRTNDDIRQVIELANDFEAGLIPRAAGTSLAGQVVGSGIIVDVSRYLTKILEVNAEERWVRVQPGVIRNELNMELARHGLLFGPETSTANRAMIGGMLGNGSCGSNSIVYGTTRDQTLEISGFLSDGSEITLGRLNKGDKTPHPFVQQTIELLSDPETREEIRRQFPKPSVARRNTGYAVDFLIESEWFGGHSGPLNPCHLIVGSEGTLMFATEIKLRCHPLPPAESGLLCLHFESVDQAMRATQIVMKNQSSTAATVFACEVIDRLVLEGAARNIEQQKTLNYIEGSPEAVLIVDIHADERPAIEQHAATIRQQVKHAKLGYHDPLFFDEVVANIWEMRRAGLGMSASMVGDGKPVALIEDSAVSVDDLPDYIREVDELLESKFDVQCVHYAHAGAGEIHLRPVLDLKTEEGVSKFREIGAEVAAIVKKYGGSLSGEHGDGRVRSEFLRDMIGDANYELLSNIKRIWDPKNIFNPGKIVDSVLMDEKFRFHAGQETRDRKTMFDFSDVGGIQRAAEMCSGSGDCRKTELTGGVMCPSYMATRNEMDTTRARANVLRQVLTSASGNAEVLADGQLKAVMDLCLGCKACKSECPSNVDMAKMKSEFLYHWQQKHGVSRRAKFIADVANLNEKATRFAGISNRLTSGKLTSGVLKKSLGIHPNRTLPQVCKTPLRKWFEKHKPPANAGTAGSVFFFCDEFTNFADVPVGIAAIELLERLGFQVIIPEHAESGRAAISVGLLDQGKRCANENVRTLGGLLSDDQPLIGVEPSALLTLRDEYPALVDPALRELAHQVASRSLLIDEFISRLIEESGVSSDLFSDKPKAVRLHGHCHQKALSSMRDTIRMLQLPRNYQVKMIPAGCCGMAGSFGYEKEHYEISMQIGELVLFPAIREEPEATIIAAGGTSCRHQILDGTGRVALHPVQILRDALCQVDRAAETSTSIFGDRSRKPKSGD